MKDAILSIQSHVAYGHVGNSAAAFTLQRMGFPVHAVHTVTLSSHKGYRGWRGVELAPGDVADIVDGMAELGVFGDTTALLSGYLGDPGMGRAVLHALHKLRAESPKALFLCDPVMGDRGCGLFVDPAIPPFFRDEMIPTADILTPNAFELGVLVERETLGLPAIVDAARTLLRRGPELVVVTSVELGAADNEMATLAVSGDEGWLLRKPRLPVALSGTGDTFAALFLGNYLRSRDIRKSLEMANSVMFELVERTMQSCSRELLLVEAQECLLAPKRLLSAERIS
ncbi:MAG: pyridoxal kinase PdxY [Geminicoccaceae bacterium]